jgi:hypothetical protein
VVVIADKNGLVWINDLTGGLNDTDAPQDLADNQCTIAQNVEWVRTKVAQRRQGGTDGIHATNPWSAAASILSLMRHTPTADEGAAELWAASNENPAGLARMAGSNQFVESAITITDAWTLVDVKYINGASLNGKFFLAGNTAVNRLHVWDGTAFRRVGQSSSAAPTVANTGAGSYAAVIRYYKVQWAKPSGDGTHFVLSELTPSVSFTPSGVGTHARVTRPTLPGDGETNWILFASPDDVNFYLILSAAVGTTTLDDNTAPSAYASVPTVFAGYPTDPDYFTVPISPKYLLADEDRLLLLSSWETASMASAVMWTPVVGSTPPEFGVSDDERVPSRNRLDVDRSDGGGITGGGLLAGTIYVFKLSHIYRLDRTGDVDLPYRAVPITKKLGAVSHKSIVEGEDDAGHPCLYFLSRRGPYRLGPYGLEYLGRDIETLWGTVNLAATTPPFGVWHETKRQVQWWVATTVSAVVPDKKLVLHVRHGQRDGSGNVRGGWAVHTEGAADAFCACMFANTLGSPMSLDLKPYVGQVWVSGLPNGPCIRYDADGRATDRGDNVTTYIARAKTGAFPPGGPGMKGRVTQAYVIGTSNATPCTLALDVIGDFGRAAETRSGTAALPFSVGGPSRVLAKVDDDARAVDRMYVELEIDDTNTGSKLWVVDAIGVRVKPEGPI